MLNLAETGSSKNVKYNWLCLMGAEISENLMDLYGLNLKIQIDTIVDRYCHFFPFVGSAKIGKL